MRKFLMAGLAAACAFGASAGMTIDLDLKAKPIRDMKTTANGVAMAGRNVEMRPE